MHKIYIAFTIALAATACAPNPESIQAASIDPNIYMKNSCDQLKAEREKLDTDLKVASAQQEATRAKDTAGVWITGLPLSSMSGSNLAPQIADMKGRQDAVRVALATKQCKQ